MGPSPEIGSGQSLFNRFYESRATFVAGAAVAVLTPPALLGYVGYQVGAVDARSQAAEHGAIARGYERCLRLEVGSKIVTLTSLTEQEKRDCGLLDVSTVDVSQAFNEKPYTLNAQIDTLALPDATSLKDAIKQETEASQHPDYTGFADGDASVGAIIGLGIVFAGAKLLRYARRSITPRKQSPAQKPI